MNDKEELIALINYLINHNAHHNDELISLASSLEDVNKDAYKKVNAAIANFVDGNKCLKDALKELSK